jgi:SAM-dependent methyltransferase
MIVPSQDRAVRDLFGTDAEAYDARQYEARYRTFIADRHRFVGTVLRGLSLPDGASLLDLACGPGRFLQDTASTALASFGLDSSRDMLRIAGDRLGPGARLTAGDGAALPFQSDCFDAVNCSGLIEYLPYPEPLVREILRVLKPGGYALVSSTNRLSPALAFEPLANAVRRSGIARRVVRALRLPFDDLALRERRFQLTFHTPGQLARLLTRVGFGCVEMRYYHLQLLPHPLDRMAPGAATACVRLTDRFLTIRALRVFAEGLLAVARKQTGVTEHTA